jgi:single-strand DNA-binding protein
MTAMNVVILVGRLTRDPELRHTPQGVPVCDFTVAVDRPGNNGGGPQAQKPAQEAAPEQAAKPPQDKGPQADFIDCVAWRQLAETTARYAAKGRLVGVQGRLEIDTYEGRDGVRRRRARIVASQVRFLDAPRSQAEDTGEEEDTPF